MRTAITERLDALGINYRIRTHKKPAYTSEDAARERGVHLSQIVKTMVLKDRSGRTVVTVLPGHKKLDLKKIKKLMKCKDLRFMDKESLEKEFGLITGAIAPVRELFGGLPIFVDPAVFDEALVCISSGDPGAGVELKRDDLEKLLYGGATIVEITKE